MSATRVMDPDLDFARMKDSLAADRWRLVSCSTEPILPGEPEHATFERDAGERIHYTFNPVCRLRVVEVLGDGVTLQLPAAGKDMVSAWLASADERTLLRGVLAAQQMPDPQLIERVAALREHPRAAIAEAAARLAGDLPRSESAKKPGPGQREQQAKAQALVAIEILKQHVTPLLHALGQDADGSVTATLRPRPEDYALAFLPEAAETARQAYETLWADPPRVTHVAPGSQLQCHVAPAGMLADDNALSWKFPGGYRAISPLLNPHRVWVAWKFIDPGKTAGMAYDGLVWLDNRWAWFPKPYRVLAQLVQ
jgi:hypothetical protein